MAEGCGGVEGEAVMHTLNSLLTQYCQLFGYSSCSNLTALDVFLLATVGMFVLLAVATVLKRIFTGISH